MDPQRTDDLVAEWHALQERDYAAEGIPMIVAAETVGAPASPRGGEPGLAAAFVALAGELAPQGADPAAILELLAAREHRARG